MSGNWNISDNPQQGDSHPHAPCHHGECWENAEKILGKMHGTREVQHWALGCE